MIVRQTSTWKSFNWMKGEGRLNFTCNQKLSLRGENAEGRTVAAVAAAAAAAAAAASDVEEH